MIPKYWKHATHELAKRDSVMCKLIERYDEAALNSRGNAFTTLARSIVGQQISVKAAESVWQRIVITIPEITPHNLYTSDKDLLRACGLSLRKINYLQDLSRHFLDGTLNETTWQEIDDETLIIQLTKVKGIGRWTAEMFLIFHMLRPNILPVDDIGLQRAMSIHYNANKPIDKNTIHTLAQPWQPWRSVATWYLWRSLDPVPVEY